MACYIRADSARPAWHVADLGSPVAPGGTEAEQSTAAELAIVVLVQTPVHPGTYQRAGGAQFGIYTGRMLPFEFTVSGPPLSHQTKNAERLAEWRAAVLAAAQARWPADEPPIDEAIEITVIYYHDRPTVRIDNDNLVKPIQDAMNGCIYEDDNLITDTHVRKTAVDGSFKVRRMSQVLADAFVVGDEFLYIRIDRAPAHEDLI